MVLALVSWFMTSSPGNNHKNLLLILRLILRPHHPRRPRETLAFPKDPVEAHFIISHLFLALVDRLILHSHCDCQV
jgi:hypothetical protein